VLTIVLEDGFDGEPVEVTVDGRTVIDEAGVRTDQRIGVAHAVQVPTPAGPFDVAVAVPSRSLRATHRIELPTDTSVGISILAGAVVFRSSPTDFTYA